MDDAGKLEKFFDDYAARFNQTLAGGEPDVQGTVDSFAEWFIESNPHGVQCGQNDDQFRAAIPRGIEFYKSIGMLSMDIVSKEIRVLDDFMQW